MDPAFTPGEHYRIQSVEYGTYLELGQRSTGPQLVLRPFKAFSENQQWSFENLFPSPFCPAEFILQNVGGSVRSSGAPTCIHFNGNITLNQTEGVTVSLASLGDEHLIKLLHNNKTASRLLWSNGSDTVAVRDDNGGIQLPNSAEDSFKWKLIPVWPSIPGDQTYTIRNIVSGLVLNINPTLVSRYSAFDNEKAGVKSAQQWEVKPLLNGKIHLRNVSHNLFVRLSKNDLSLIGHKEGEPWQLTRVGGIGYTITVQPPGITGTGKVFALTLLEGSNQIALAPSNDLSNQVWFLEWAPNQLQSRLDGVVEIMELVAGSDDPQKSDARADSPE